MNIRLTAVAAIAASLIAAPALARRSSDDTQAQTMQGTSFDQQQDDSTQKQRHSKRQHKKRHARKHSRRHNRDDDTLQSPNGLQSTDSQRYRQ